MPKISMSVPHALSQEEALERIKNFMPRVRQHYQEQVSNLQEAWEGDKLIFSFTTFGFNVKGDMEPRENEVLFHGDLPFAAMMFKGKIESAIREQLAKLLA